MDVSLRVVWLGLALMPFAALAGFDGWLHEKARSVPRIEQVLHAISALSLIAFVVLVFRALDAVAAAMFMDRFSYHQDRISACCHHMLDTNVELVSFCEYKARIRQVDSWERLPRLERHAER